MIQGWPGATLKHEQSQAEYSYTLLSVSCSILTMSKQVMQPRKNCNRAVTIFTVGVLYMKSHPYMLASDALMCGATRN